MEAIYLGRDSDGNEVYRVYGAKKTSSKRAYKVSNLFRTVYWYVNSYMIKGAKSNIVTNKDTILVSPEQDYFDKLNYFNKLESNVS